MNINVESKDSLFKAIDCLHDATFSGNTLIHNEESKTLDITLERGYWENKENFKRKFIFPFIWRIEVPIVKCLLHLDNIKNYRVESNDKTLKQHSIKNIESKKDGFIIKCCEVLTIYFEINGNPKGYLKDALPPHRLSRHYNFFGIEFYKGV